MSLRDLFPRFVDGPALKSVLLSIFYLLVREFLLSGLLLIVGGAVATADDLVASMGSLILQAIIDLVVMFLIFREYLSESMQSLRLEWPTCFKTIAIGVGIAAGINAVIFLCTGLLVPAGDLFLHFPTNVMACVPLVNLIFLVVLAPVAFCCMFHATFFGGLCGERPWLAYPLVALVLVALHYFGNHDLALFPSVCLCMLPTHLLGCWVYQKTNTVWSSIILVAAVNLLMVLAYLLFPQLVLNTLMGL